MKKVNIFIVLAIIAICYFSCEKPKPEPEPEPDYRDKWVGTYECEEVYSWWRRTGIPLRDTSGTEIFHTIVDVTVIGDSMLKFIESRNRKSYETEVSVDGYFFKFEMGRELRVEGNFIGDSIYMYVIPPHGIGYSMSSNYKGKKNKNK